MIVYTNSADRKVTLDVPLTPVAGTEEVQLIHEGQVKHTFTQLGDDLSVVLPYAFVTSDKEYELRWRFRYNEGGSLFEFEQYQPVSVVTPILTLSEIRAIVDEEGEEWTDAEVMAIEKSVRLIIQAHTGQFFGKYIGVKSISGSGETSLRLPTRLITLNSLNENTYWNDSLAVRGGGWYVVSKTWGVPSVRADFHGWHESVHNAPVRAPQRRSLFTFVEHAEYKIDGVWGWNAVPEEVKEAARLLVNDYACGEGTYRDRFLSSIQAADWRLQFHDGAFANTGNVRANQLLASYVLKRGWLVI